MSPSSVTLFIALSLLSLCVRAQGGDPEATISRDLPLPIGVLSVEEFPGEVLAVSNPVRAAGGVVQVAVAGRSGGRRPVIGIYSLDTTARRWVREAAWKPWTLPAWAEAEPGLRLVLTKSGTGSLGLSLVSEAAVEHSQQILFGAPGRPQGVSEEELGLPGHAVLGFMGSSPYALQYVAKESAPAYKLVAFDRPLFRHGLPFAPLHFSQTLWFPDGRLLVFFRGDGRSTPAELQAQAIDAQGLAAEPLKVGREEWKCGEGEAPTPAAVAVAAPRAAAAWFTADAKEPRILLSQTPDAGQRWTAAVRVDLGRPKGEPVLHLQDDSSVFIAWEEQAGEDASLPEALYFRRYGPNGSSVPPALVMMEEPHSPAAVLGLSVAEEETPGKGALLALLRCDRGRLTTRLVRLPSGKALEEADSSCKCGPGPGAGHQLRASIETVNTQEALVVLRHQGLPGLLRPGTLVVSPEPSLAAALRPGVEALVRVRQDALGWHLTELRVLGASAR